MKWKKNAFSYVIWFAYTVLTGAGLVGLGGMLCAGRGIPAYWGIPAAVAYAAVVCGVTILLHRFAAGYSPIAEKKREHLLVLEVLAFLLLLAAGIMLRVWGAEGAEQSSVYYDMARVAAGQSIPQTVHGAVYFYCYALHGVLLLVGNHFMAGIWFQIFLQLAGMVMLYFVVRRLGGAIAALVTFGFGMCAPFMVQSAMVLSPDMLYFCILTAAGLLITAGRGRVISFLFMGIAASLCAYIDIMGVLLMILALALVFGRRGEESFVGKKPLAFILCILGAVLGFVAWISLDAFLSGKAFLGVARAWLALYEPGSFCIPAAVGAAEAGTESLVLFGLMAFGIFSFWCDRKGERLTVAMLAVGAVMAAGCYGIFTEEMPGYFCLFLLFAILAGVGLGQCLHMECGGGPSGEGKTQEASAGKDQGKEPQKDTAEAASEPGAIEIVDLEKENPDAIPVRELEKGKPDMDSEKGKAEEKASAGKNQGKEPQKDKAEAAGEPGAIEIVDLEKENPDSDSERKTDKDRDGGNKEEPPQVQPTSEEKAEAPAQEREEKPIQFIENPLPLPKKHVKRVLDYPLQVGNGEDDFDHPVAEDDDFDI